MHANHILSRWDRVKATGHVTPTEWFVMLTVASFGSKGCDIVSLAAKAGMHPKSVHSYVSMMLHHLFITCTKVPSQTPINKQARLKHWLTITPRALRFLGLDPVPETADSEPTAPTPSAAP